MAADDPAAGTLDGNLAALAALGDPVRRTLYHFVTGQDHAVSRDEAAAAAGLSRSAAAFHLDRMVEDGLLETEFRRLSGRRGPGAGRPAKLYRRVGCDIEVSLPARRYADAADLLATAVVRSTETGQPVDAVLDELARGRGARLGAAAAAGSAVDVLAGEGYEPRLDGDDLVLANCPFHTLAAGHPALVCGMNLALLQGFAAALPEQGWEARLQPWPGHCCVRLARAGPA